MNRDDLSDTDGSARRLTSRSLTVKELAMTLSRKLLMETLVGHFAWLQATHPDKAASPLARKARRHARTTLRKFGAHERRAAA